MPYLNQSTLFCSAVETALLTQCSYKIHQNAKNCNTGKDARKMEVLQYFAHPADSVIQATALPIFTAIDHCRDISQDTSRWRVAKICFSPITLPAKLLIALVGSALSLIYGITQVVLPIHTIIDICRGRKAAEKFFADREELKKNNPKALDLLNRTHSAEPVQTAGELPSNITEKIVNILTRRQPKNAIEYLISIVAHNPQLKDQLIDTYGLKDEMFLRPYHQRKNQQQGGGLVTGNVLFSMYLGELDGCLCLTPSGKYLGEKSPKGLVAYTPEMGILVSPKTAYDSIKQILTYEIEKNPAERPQKIILPMTWEKNGIAHATQLVIEPSSEDLHEARITMINTNGNAPRLFIDFEHEVIKAAKEVYASSKSVAIRNEKSIYTTSYSCSIDTIEIARDLVHVSNVQEAVKKGLRRRTSEQDRAARERHGKDVLDFFRHLSQNWNVGGYSRPQFFT